MKKLLLLGLAVLSIGFTFAVETTTSNTKMAASELVPPVDYGITSYAFDEASVKTLAAKDNILLQLNCNGIAILQSLGFGASASKIFSVGLTEGDFDYTFDVRNCSLRGNKTNANYNYNKTLTEKEAFALADTFMKTSYLKDKIFTQVGQPFVVYRNTNGPYYPLMRDESKSSVTIPGIEIEEGDTKDIYPEYTSFSIMYPYLINGQEIWEQYGSRAGIQLEVYADGVMSVNARLLPFKAAKRNSEKVTGDDAVRILKNGGNAPFYGAPQTVTFKAPQKVYVMFNLWRDNKSYLYLASGIGLKSDLKVDQWAQQPYTMVIADYKIGNSAQ